ncbi:hypothetical protein ABZP36_016106 [Zizania latifolia]
MVGWRCYKLENGDRPGPPGGDLLGGAVLVPGEEQRSQIPLPRLAALQISINVAAAMAIAAVLGLALVVAMVGALVSGASAAYQHTNLTADFSADLTAQGTSLSDLSAGRSFSPLLLTLPRPV